jgi:hypothetical protein
MLIQFVHGYLLEPLEGFDGIVIVPQLSRRDELAQITVFRRETEGFSSNDEEHPEFEMYTCLLHS